MGTCGDCSTFCASAALRFFLKKVPAAEEVVLAHIAASTMASKRVRSSVIMFHHQYVLAHGTGTLQVRVRMPATHVNQIGGRECVGDFVA